MIAFDYSEIPDELNPQEWASLLHTMSNGDIPTTFPQAIPIDDSFHLLRKFPQNPIAITFPLRVHESIQDLGMYGLISQEGAKFLLEKFPNHRLLDPLAGRGWFAKAIREQGGTVIAGDIKPPAGLCVTDVIESDGKDLVSKYKSDSDILFLSWPYREDPIDYQCAKEWGEEKLIICYGEIGRSCFSQKFLRKFEPLEILNDFPDMKGQTLKRTFMVTGRYKPD